MDNTVLKGVITKVTSKGFGFIRCSGVGEKGSLSEGAFDVFFHASSCIMGLAFDSLQEGVKVCFAVKDTEKGKVAFGVMKDESGK